MLSREAKHYQCLDDDNKPSCGIRHQSSEAMTRCKRGSRAGARTKAGDLVAVRIKHIGASNGESATLAYPLYEIQEGRR